MAKEQAKLLSDFPPVSGEEWMAQLTKDLKGAPFDKKMVWRTQEGFDLKPFYQAEDLADFITSTNLPDTYPYVRSTRMTNEWLVRQDITVEDPKTANEKALQLLNKGVTSLGFKLKRSQLNDEAFGILLKNVVPEAVELNFSACVSVAVELTRTVANYLSKHAADPKACRGSIAYNPFKKELVRGIRNAEWAATCKQMMEAARPMPGYRLFAVDASILADAGAYITQQLGYALSWGQQFVDTLTDEGYTVPEVASRLQFNFGVGTNYFMEIGKFRAARWLWAQIIGAYGQEYQNETAKLYQHAITTTWNKTVFDAHVNLLRTQTESMSAALGGVDSITVQPFDVTYKLSDEFSERMARNQQLLLKEECHLDKVLDPAAGSYYIEKVTDAIATEAWKLFLSVEDEGGFYAAISAGKVQKVINTTNAKRHQAIAGRKESLLGTNQFPNFTEVATSKIEYKEEHHDCACGAPEIEILDFSRGASDFERVRLAVECSGKTPKVFMLTIGNLAMRLARSQFSSNFFACAGYGTIDNLGFDTVEQGIDAALKAEADIVCICSSDDEYATYAVPAYKYLDGRALFVVAGAPECAADLEAEGVTNFINVRSNVLETLGRFNQELGINA